MQIACLPYASTSATLRRVLSGTSSLDAVVLPAAARHDGGEWVTATLGQLRRELFLEPELQVLAAVEPTALDRVTLAVAEMLCEARSEHTTIARVRAVAKPESLVEWLAAGEELRHARTGAELDESSLLESAHVELGAAPVVEACEAGASVVLAELAAPGTLALAAAYDTLTVGAHDWNLLATASALAWLAEQPGEAAPLWMVTDGSRAHLEGLPTLTAAALEARFAELGGEQQVLRTPDVEVDLSQAVIVAEGNGHFRLRGAMGSPPAARSAVELYFRSDQSDRLEAWPTSVAKTLVDWDATVRPAGDWRRSE